MSAPQPAPTTPHTIGADRPSALVDMSTLAAMRLMLVRTVWLNGTVGAGKTTVGEALAKLLADAGEAVAFINTDDIGRSWRRSGERSLQVRLRGRPLTPICRTQPDASAARIAAATSSAWASSR
jgi:Ni2+-binding GTPase involved in maturation of urease and hydrogenase